MSEVRETGQAAAWFLERYHGVGRGLERIPLAPLPFLVGRQSTSNLALSSSLVSMRHAELYADTGRFWVRDLGSTNGTFVNEQRVQDATLLADGDILHFADQEFRLAADPEVFNLDSTQVLTAGQATLEMPLLELQRRLLGGRKELQQLLALRAVTAMFQPILRLADGERVGFEALGRGCLPGLPQDPGALFEIANAFKLDRQLSHLMREQAIEAARDFEGKPLIFFNTHPAELADVRGLLASLSPLQSERDHFSAVLEIHESAVSDINTIRMLRLGLSELGIGLAYDDFGAGQARLVHLSEAPPDYLKFDISMVRGLDTAGKNHRDLLASLVRICREAGITTLAEGLERPAEAEAAKELGFELAQGFLFGAAQPVGSDTRPG